MRVRRLGAAPEGFALALPPPDTSYEMQVKHKNELFINVDDTSVSPMITTNGSLFPARFFHLNNTNLFVLMDGVSMFTEGKLACKEGESPHQLVGEETEDVAVAKAAKKSPPSKMTAPVDSVEAAIRGIEGEGSDVFAFSAVQAPRSSTAKDTCLGAHALSTTATLTGESFVREKSTTRVPSVENNTSIPKGYAALFAGSVDPLPAVLKSKLSGDDHVIKVRGFLPGGVDKRRRPSASLSTSAPLECCAPLPVVPREGVVSSFTGTPMAETAQQNLEEKRRAQGKQIKNKRKTSTRLPSADEVGRSNRSLDLDAVVTLCFIGKGTQGTVHRVMLDDKLYALKCIDVKEVTEATNVVERQGRKRGLVKELNMISLQRSRERPMHLMQVFNAVATLDSVRPQLYILMELMSFSVEDAQKMVSRFPAPEMMKMTQSTFSKHLAGPAEVQKQTDNLLKQRAASYRHLTGRSSYNIPEDWETNIDRQTPVPEVILSMLAADVLKGLAELHEEYHIVHCDLKPANVLLDFSMSCFKIADFGCGCQMDKETRVVRRTGIDLGSKLYKAPERLRNELGCAEMEDGVQAVEFTVAADVWSLGIMLLELSNGVHPCYSFKSDYWNYVNNLKLSRMVKPLAWSAAFHNFIVRCLMREVKRRGTVNELLQHPFILRYSAVPRARLTAFMKRLKSESETFQKRQQRELLIKQILLSTGGKSADLYRNESCLRWKSFTGFLAVAPRFEDHEKFPQLS